MTKTSIILGSIATALAFITIWVWCEHLKNSPEIDSELIATPIPTGVSASAPPDEKPRWEDTLAKNNHQFYVRTAEELSTLVHNETLNYRKNQGWVVPKMKDGRYTEVPKP